MCILCVVQRWSRRVATMLPWLVIPFIVVWALSQLLPRALRFEITSPRLGCVAVLLATLFWYEVLMPHLSSWRARRAASFRERRRTEALELQKRRKTAIRHCRNCHMPYRNQTPGGGRFMCSYCGHISRKPVLDLPSSTTGPGVITDIVRKHDWLCDADGSCNLVGSVPKYWTGSYHWCSTEISYSGVMVFSSKLLSFFGWSMRWLCGKLFKFGFSKEDTSSDLDRRGSSRKGDIVGNFQESRGEKARRKAEERRQARLEKEILEVEERKQKEEVARLVEERRKLRDEKMVAEKDRSKGPNLDGVKDGRKEIDRTRDRRKDKDKTSCKSNSDGEELEKRTSRQNERKRECLKKGENERFDLLKSMGDNYKSHAFHAVNGSNVLLNKPRYFDAMKGTLLSSSRGLGGSSFSGRNTQKSAAVVKSVKLATGSKDHDKNTVKRRGAHPVAYAVSKPASSAGENAYGVNFSQPAATDFQPKTGFKTSWQQLFTRSSEVSPCPDSNPTTHKTGQLLAKVDQQSRQKFMPSCSTSYNQVQFGQAEPFTAYPSRSTLLISNPISHIVSETTFPPLKKSLESSFSEDAELFEDTCHVPDPISLLGPVSGSLDYFPLDFDAEVAAKANTEQYPLSKSGYTSAEANRPLSIESLLSKSHVPEEIHKSDQLFCTPRSDVSTKRHEQFTWQMWGTPWSQEGLGLVGCPSSLFSSAAHNNSQLRGGLHSLSHKPIIPPISKNHNIQYVHKSNHQQTGGTNSPVGPSLKRNGLWQQNSSFQSSLQVDGDDLLLPLNPLVDLTRSEATYSSLNKSTAVQSFETHQASSWSKDAPQEAVNLNSGSADDINLFSRGPDAPSVWSFNQQ